MACLVVFALTLPAVAQEKANLSWKFDKDKFTFYQTMTTKAEQTLTVMNNPVKQTQEQTFFFKWTLTEVNAEKKEATLKQEIIGVKVSIDIGGSKTNYDSTSTDAATANPLSDFFKALQGSEFTLVLDTTPGAPVKIKEIKGAKEFVEKLSKTNPQLKPLLEQILSEKALREMAEPTFAAIPGKEVTKGDKTREPLVTKLNLGPIGSYETTFNYTYGGPTTDKKFEQINVATDIKYTPPDEKTPGAGLPFKIKEAKLDPSDATGQIVFDTGKGRIVSSKTGVKIKGKLKIDIGGQLTDVDVEQNQTTTITNSDDNPTQKRQ